MIRCTSCSADVHEDSRYCSSCGSSLLSPSQIPTTFHSPEGATPGRSMSATPSVVGRLASSDSIDLGHFAPGAVLDGRYRIIGLIGRGGMGEVYRADDLRLGQPVALKFLPRNLAEDPVRRERFFSEVRIARQVSHPNVCRVYDIGDFDGLHFLSMEYVDGEDLASLLKRIGRLSTDKAVEVARQMCAGLAAAHDKGVLHRDLKPANVMLDGRGRVRITDFGLATAIEEADAESGMYGTPSYMAPEQLAGRPASPRSDIYALGLVLYEMCTGRKPFEAGSVAELRRMANEDAPPSPSSMSRDIDPVVERVILRCLEKDPRARPASAIQVAAALPGGDPLAAALAAGETPSPEMVAAAGEFEGLKPGLAWACLGALVAGILLSVLLSSRMHILSRIPHDKPPAVLAEMSREILQKNGWSGAAYDTAQGFFLSGEMTRYFRAHNPPGARWDNLDRTFLYWYRQSPRALGAETFFGPYLQPGTVTLGDPPNRIGRMARVILDTKGRLQFMEVVPPQLESAAEPPLHTAWEGLLAQAGLDPSSWKPVEPKWTPPVFSDARAAWEGSLVEWPGLAFRIEAASYRGRPVYFELIGPWTLPDRDEPRQTRAGEIINQVILLALLVALLFGSVRLARRNLRMGRGDRRGATRVATAVLILLTGTWLFGASHVPTFYEVGLSLMFLSWALFLGLFVWVLYIALEPYVRGRWPATIISWSRLLAGGVRDPLVGRDLLVGLAAGAWVVITSQVVNLVPVLLGASHPAPTDVNVMTLLGPTAILASLLNETWLCVFFGFALLFLLLTLRTLLRRQWLAATVVVLIMSLTALGSEEPLLSFVLSLLLWGLMVFVFMRFGLLAGISSLIALIWFSNFPITFETSAWYSGAGFFALTVMMALAIFGFFTSLGGRSPFGASRIER
jgi:hypothetical protein